MKIKIVSWNCNMAFRNKSSILDDFNPDIAVIQECESKDVLETKKSNIQFDDYIWVGNNKNKGLGVMTFNGFKAELLNYNQDFQYVIPIRIYNQSTEVYLLAVWTQMVNKDIYSSYVVQATRAILYYKEILQQENVFMIGDFNSNAIWDNNDHKEYNHTQMVSILNDFQISSVYHEKKQEEHGEETTPTLYFRKDKDKPYHVDYIFLKENLLKYVKNYWIGDYSKFIGQSDHMPMFIEIVK